MEGKLVVFLESLINRKMARGGQRSIPVHHDLCWWGMSMKVVGLLPGPQGLVQHGSFPQVPLNFSYIWLFLSI